MSNNARYIVIVDFIDLQDGNKEYKVGEKFPKPANKKISKKRLDELATSKNRRKQPLIEKVEEAIVQEVVEETKEDNEKE